VLVDVQQVIPLPEAAAYQVQIKEKQQREREARQSKDYTKYDVVIAGQPNKHLPKNRAIFAIVKYLCEKLGVTPDAIQESIGGRKRFRGVDGLLNSQEFLARQSQVDPQRFFCNDVDLIHFEGKTYAFSNQWGTQTADAINSLLKNFPNKNVICEKAL
jgi:uncharacterized glyoxalase superfamily metalloenzyme YdcJ